MFGSHRDTAVRYNRLSPLLLQQEGVSRYLAVEVVPNTHFKPEAAKAFLSHHYQTILQYEFRIRHAGYRKPRRLHRNCTMTNVMHKFLIYLSIYFCLTCFGRSVSPSSEAAVVQVCWVWCQRQGTDTIPSRLEPLPKLYTCKAEVNT
jgi:hypothetical protein